MSSTEHLIDAPAFVDELDREFESWSDLPASSLCQRVELYLLERLYKHTTEFFRALSQKRNEFFSLSGNEGFVFGDSAYVVELSQHRTFLRIEIRSIDTTAGKVSRKIERIKFNSPGRHTEIQIRTDRHFEQYQPELCEACATLVQTGYRWLEQQVLATLSRFRDEVAEDLYMTVRKTLPAHLADYLWFFVIVENSSFYLPDRHSLDIALARTKRRLIQGLDSPLELISQFAETDLIVEDTCSKEAIDSNQILSQDVQKAKYVVTGFQIAEQAIYDCHGIWVHPLVREGKALLTVGYPAHPSELREKLFQTLERLKPKFKFELERRSKSFRHLIDDLKKQRAIPGTAGDIAYVAGRFLQGLGNLPTIGK